MSSAPKTRPKYYDLNLAHLPPPGLVSILHRISGILLFFPILPIVLYVLPESSQIHKRVYAADAPGRPIVEETFFDYRDVDGIQFAFRATQKIAAASVERRVTDVKINTPVDPALFKRPSS